MTSRSVDDLMVWAIPNKALCYSSNVIISIVSINKPDFLWTNVFPLFWFWSNYLIFRERWTDGVFQIITWSRSNNKIYTSLLVKSSWNLREKNNSKRDGVRNWNWSPYQKSNKNESKTRDILRKKIVQFMWLDSWKVLMKNCHQTDLIRTNSEFQ